MSARLLWIDDEIDLLRPHCIFLEKRGYDITTANNGADAVDLCKAQAFDLVLLDENMPGLSGLETLSAIKDLHPEMPVVMVTKNEAEDLMDQAIGAQITDYLLKPVNPMQILLALKKHIHAQEIRQEHTEIGYRQDFSRIALSMDDAQDAEAWKELYKKLVHWELQLEEAPDSAMNELLRTQKEDAIKGQDYEKAAALRDQEQKVLAEKAEAEKAWRENGDAFGEVTPEVISEVLASSTGVPVYKITEEESSRLIKMEDELHKRVIGQDNAIKALSRAIRRTRAGLKDPRRPGGSFIFAGPTGVGKTELAKALAEFLFGDEDALITLDMSEYQEKHTVSRLFGAPPGYVGYDEGGQLTEAVRRKPYAVVLFDEIEKAHPDVFNILLQVLDDGRITDSQGRTVDFKNTIIILTSNIGAQTLLDGISENGDIPEDVRKEVMEALHGHFRPEFLNRLDEIILFKPLVQKDMERIADLILKDINKRLQERRLHIHLQKEALDFILENAYEPGFGARPLKRYMQKHVETLVAKEILEDRVKEGDTIEIRLQDGKLTAAVV